MITLFTAIEQTEGGVRIGMRAGFNMRELKDCGEFVMPYALWLDWRRVCRHSYYSQARVKYAADSTSRIPDEVSVDREEMFIIIDDKTTGQVMTSMLAKGDA